MLSMKPNSANSFINYTFLKSFADIYHTLLQRQDASLGYSRLKEHVVGHDFFATEIAAITDFDYIDNFKPFNSYSPEQINMFKHINLNVIVRYLFDSVEYEKAYHLTEGESYFTSNVIPREVESNLIASERSANDVNVGDITLIEVDMRKLFNKCKARHFGYIDLRTYNRKEMKKKIMSHTIHEMAHALQYYYSDNDDGGIFDSNYHYLNSPYEIDACYYQALFDIDNEIQEGKLVKATPIDIGSKIICLLEGKYDKILSSTVKALYNRRAYKDYSEIISKANTINNKDYDFMLNNNKRKVDDIVEKQPENNKDGGDDKPKFLTSEIHNTNQMLKNIERNLMFNLSNMDKCKNFEGVTIEPNESKYFEVGRASDLIRLILNNPSYMTDEKVDRSKLLRAVGIMALYGKIFSFSGKINLVKKYKSMVDFGISTRELKNFAIYDNFFNTMLTERAINEMIDRF